MSNFNRFFKKNVRQEDDRVYVEVSDRITDDNGNPFKWVLKSLKKSELLKLADKHFPSGKDKQSSTTNKAYTSDLLEKTIIEPNLANAELQDDWGVMGAFDLLDEMLNNKEFDDLIEKVNEVNGFNREKDVNKSIKEVKN